ncbi:alpha beta hydrolase fold protein [Moniliophthora roreri MCA 2997]|uniref:Alpha beta hydrolase fold protein n=1 Tax=Moniliophthora roreri (strain MCA 2997) TaxID=1381753 RepID=V2YNF2_MONRO|nr:alpha beta hydrolase fold protein [Moniliophthora roreri MCA 2997]
MGMLSTRELYETWSRKRGLAICVEEIEGVGARVVWLDGKKTNHVIYYMHGGGYALPLQDFQLAFWRHVQLELKKKHGIDVGVAILHYSLTPNAPFPTILRQAVGGLRLLFDQGIQSKDIYLAGDSAGGNLILQLFSHILHPLPTVPTISCNTFRGAYLMSPWVSLSNEEGDQAAHDDTDILCSRSLAEFAAFVLCDVPASQRPYVEVLKASESWFDGLNEVVNGIMISIGDKECFREEDVKLYERLHAKHSDVQMVLQEFGVHIDPMIDAFIGEKLEGAITPRVVEWLAKGFRG